MKQYKKSCCIVCKKVCAILACAVVLAVMFVPCVVAEGDIVNSLLPGSIPDGPFTCSYYNLMAGKNVISPEFPALPKQVLTDAGWRDVGNYVLYKQVNNSMETYILYLFEGEAQPSDVEIEYSFTGTPTWYKEAYEKYWFEHKFDSHGSAISEAFVGEYYGQLTVPVLWEAIFFKKWMELYWKNFANAADMYSNDWWKRELLSMTDDSILKIYQTCAEDGIKPWLSVDLCYKDTIKNNIAAYRYDASTHSWKGINLIRPSGSYYFTMSGIENMIATSFSFYNSDVLTGSKGSIVDEWEDYVEENPIKRPVSNSGTPSWDDNINNGGNDGDTVGDSFLNGSWYNDGGTGNPFVALFVAPWLGINWTYENVATEISLFGVSVADLISTCLVVLVAAAFIAVLVSWLGGKK